MSFSPEDDSLRSQVIIYESPDDVLRFAPKVALWADENRDTFGFLPKSVYEVEATSGHLWVAALSASEPVGYLLFGGVFPHLRIAQLYVDSNYRGKGIGERLVQRLSEFASARQYLTIRARVAADLAANGFYQRCRFHIVRQVRGGAAKDRLINVRLLELDGTGLFAEVKDEIDPVEPMSDLLLSSRLSPQLTEAVFVIDLNVFFDLIKVRDGAERAAQLIRSGLARRVNLRVSAEFRAELRRNAAFPQSDPILKLAEAFPALGLVPAERLQLLEQELQRIVFPHLLSSHSSAANSESDLRHLAACIYFRASAFVTSEKAILRSASQIKLKYALDILTPADALALLEEELGPPPVTGTGIGGSELTILRLDEAVLPEAEAFLTDLGAPSEVIQEAARIGSDDRVGVRFIAMLDHQIIGYAAWKQSPGTPKEVAAYLYVDESNRAAQKFVDHVLVTLIQSAEARRALVIGLHTLPHQIRTRETANRVGYLRVYEEGSVGPANAQKKLTLPWVVTSANWHSFSGEFQALTSMQLPERCPKEVELSSTGLPLRSQNGNRLRLLSQFDFESRYGPVFILGEGREGALVPIVETYANELIQSSARQGSFFFGGEGVLHLERAYFCRSSPKGLYVKGRPLIFYVSGAGRGRMEAVGVGRITFSDVLTVDQVAESLHRQGVLAIRYLREMARKSGHLTVVTFDNFLPFSNPVSFHQLKSAGIIGKANLITGQLLDCRQLRSILEYAFPEK